MHIKLNALNDRQQAAVAELLETLEITSIDDGIPVQVTQSGTGIFVKFDGQAGVIQYEHDHQLFRGLGLLVEGLKKSLPFEIEEQPVYQSLGVMVDCSRNAVLHEAAFRKLIRHLALMGYSTVQLYTEDTYEMDAYPYFGYMRGRYTGEQMRSMDRYSQQFGIELVPCIQTLAHLGPALKWKAHEQLLDCNDILLIDEPATYELIEHMFRTMSENLASRKINIGMDEAHMMGLGKYLDKHGYQDRSALMLKHFGKVMEIARRFGYKPMMWSDMFFRLASAGEYYDINSPIRQDIVELIPDDITLVYWDYYSEQPEKYSGMMKKHKQLCDKIVFAGGAWKWMGFSPNNEFSKHIAPMAHESCAANGIKDVLITIWGDNGAECSVFSILPALQIWAELAYTNRMVEDRLLERFDTCVGGNFHDFMNLDLANLTPDNAAPGRCSVNPQKYLLYQDIMCGLFDRHVMPGAYAEHYRDSADQLEQAKRRNPKWQSLFQTQHTLCNLLEIKCEAGLDIRNAYLNCDKTTLERYGKERLPELKRRAEQFIQAFSTQWNEENQIFGLDVFDLRMGGLLQRIDTAMARINGYLSGELPLLEELEQSVLYYDGRAGDGEQKAISANLWHTIATPSVIAGI